jgi:hypothetical protein
MNKKRGCAALLLPWVCVLLELGFPACSKNQNPDYNNKAGSAIRKTELYQNGRRNTPGGEYRLEQAQSYYNTSLGISFTVDKGWWVFDLNTANFSSAPGDTADPAGFDIIHEAGYSRIDLINFGNTRYPDRKNHLNFDISVEFRENSPQNGDVAEPPPGLTIREWSDEGALADYLSRFLPINPQTDSIVPLDSGPVNIKTIPFEKRVYRILQAADDYRIIFLNAALKPDYYLVISVLYEQTFKDAESYIFDLIDRALALE